jgi:hypothetical protein
LSCHADGDRFAVQQVVGIAALGLQRMAEGVAEVEQRPRARFPFVGDDDRRLGTAARGDRRAPRAGLA